MDFDPEAWRKRLFETGDYDGYRGAGAKALATNPHEYYVTQEQWVKAQVDRYVDALVKHPVGARRLVLIGLGYLKVPMAAQRANLRAYMGFREQYEETRTMNEEAMRRILRAPRDSANRGGGAETQLVLHDMDENLQRYQRRLEYYYGLARLVETKEPVDLAEVSAQGAREMEASLAKLLGQDSVLGDEYRHLRNAFGHGTYRVLDGEKGVEFVDRNKRTGKVWRKSYDQRELVAAFVAVGDMLLALAFADALETWLLVSIFVRTTSLRG